MTDEQKRAVPICEHIKTNNQRCGSPALRGFHFCYYHARSRPTTRPNRKAKIKVGALQTNRSIENVLDQVTRAVFQDEISPAKGNTLSRLLRLAQNVVSGAGAPGVQPASTTQRPPSSPSARHEEALEHLGTQTKTAAR